MSEQAQTPNEPETSDQALWYRRVALVCATAGTAFWIYTFHYISRLPAGDGSGFQWIAQVPLTGIFLFFMMPAFLLAIPRRTTWVAALLGALGAVLYAMLWAQLLSEFKT